MPKSHQSLVVASASCNDRLQGELCRLRDQHEERRACFVGQTVDHVRRSPPVGLGAAEIASAPTLATLKLRRGDSTNILLEARLPGWRSRRFAGPSPTPPGVAGVHDLHLWVSGADQPSCTAHVVLADGTDGDAVRYAIAERLQTDFDVHHDTIQTERRPCDDRATLHP